MKTNEEGKPNISDLIKKAEKFLDLEDQLRNNLIFSPRGTLFGVGKTGSDVINRLKYFSGSYENLETIAVYPSEIFHSNIKKERKFFEKILADTGLAIITTDLEDNINYEISEAIIEAAKKTRVNVIAITTLPYSHEKEKLSNTSKAINNLLKSVDLLIIIDKNKVLELMPEKNSKLIASLVTQLMAETILGLFESMYKPGLINIDYHDILDISEKLKYPATLAYWEGSPEELENINPLVFTDIDNKKVEGSLLQITMGPNGTIKQSEKIVESMYGKINPDSRIIWGTKVDESFQNRIKLVGILFFPPALLFKNLQSDKNILSKNQVYNERN